MGCRYTMYSNKVDCYRNNECTVQVQKYELIKATQPVIALSIKPTLTQATNCYITSDILFYKKQFESIYAL